MDKDKQLALHVTKVHSKYGAGETENPPPEQGEQDDVLNLGFKPFDHNFMRSFIRRAKSYEPMIDDELQQDIVNAYVSSREDEKHDKNKKVLHNTQIVVGNSAAVSGTCKMPIFTKGAKTRF